MSGMNIDIMFDGNGEHWRIDRLINTYMRIAKDLRLHIVKLTDTEGVLTAIVRDKNINTYNALKDAWALEAEYHVVIVHDKRIVCESFG